MFVAIQKVKRAFKLWFIKLNFNKSYSFIKYESVILHTGVSISLKLSGCNFLKTSDFSLWI